jgi:hypothetical protein
MACRRVGLIESVHRARKSHCALSSWHHRAGRVWPRLRRGDDARRHNWNRRCSGQRRCHREHHEQRRHRRQRGLRRGGRQWRLRRECRQRRVCPERLPFRASVGWKSLQRTLGCRSPVSSGSTLHVGRRPKTRVPNGCSLRRRKVGDLTSQDDLQRASPPPLLSYATSPQHHPMLRHHAVLLVRRRNALPMQRLSGRHRVSDLPADRSP